MSNHPTLDAGGVHRQVYNAVYKDFLMNKHVKLFSGPSHKCRPLCTAESGLFKLLGMMIGHSLSQDGIGFLYLSKTCFWYMFQGEEKALEYMSADDVVSTVCFDK